VSLDTGESRAVRIGICGPMTLSLLQPEVQIDPELGDGYSFPFVSHLVLELLARGHEVAAFTLTDSTTTTREFRGPRLVVHIGPYRPRARDRARDFFRSERRALHTSISAEAPQVVHSHWSYEFALGAMSSGLPTLVTAHDWPPAVFRAGPDRYRAMRLAMGMYTLQRARHLTAPSPYVARRVSRWTRRVVQVVPNGVPVGPPRTAERLDPSSPLFGAVNSGWGRLKNVSTLLEAFAEFRCDVPRAGLALAGHGYEIGGPAWQWADSKGLLQNVAFHGPLSPDGVRDFMARLDAFVHPSLEESFGVVLIEALSLGIPIIAGSRSGAVPWVLDHGRMGMLVDVTSSRGIARGLQSLLDDPDRYARLVRLAPAYVRDHFSIEHVAGQFEQEYEKIVKAQTRNAGGSRQWWLRREGG
jgi:glycosyltransferase involved in cell wall biosynthesis